MYEGYFGFTSKPFQLLPDPKFFFSSQSHRKALAYLRYGLSKGEGLVIITGDIGTGKSTITKTLYTTWIKEGAAVIANIRHSLLESNELLFAVAKEFSIELASAENKAQIIHLLERKLLMIRQQGKKAVLLVDEAQALQRNQLEDLRLLTNMEHNGSPILQVCLIGQTELRTLLKQPHMEHFRQRVVVAYHLTAFSLGETRDYILHRLKMVNWCDNNPMFTDDAFIEIHANSGGIPRRINMLCDRVLLFAALEKCDMIAGEHVRTVANELANEFGADELDDTHTNAPSVAHVASASNCDIDSALVESLKQELAQLRHDLEEERRFMRHVLLRIIEHKPIDTYKIKRMNNNN